MTKKKKYIVISISLILILSISCWYFVASAMQQQKIAERAVKISDKSVLEFIKFDKNSDIFTENSDENALNIIEYGSFTCHHCAGTSKVLAKIKRKYKNKVRIIYRNIIGDLFAFNAVKILKCLDIPNAKKDKIVELIYLSQMQWIDVSSPDHSADNILRLIEKSGFNIGGVKKCMKNEHLDDEIIDHQNEIRKMLNITAVPMIIVGDQKIQGDVRYKKLNKIVKQYIK